jgi:hypothetical protein
MRRYPSEKTLRTQHESAGRGSWCRPDQRGGLKRLGRHSPNRGVARTAPAKVVDPELRALAELGARHPGEFVELIERESVMRALARL